MKRQARHPRKKPQDRHITTSISLPPYIHRVAKLAAEIDDESFSHLVLRLLKKELMNTTPPSKG